MDFDVTSSRSPCPDDRLDRYVLGLRRWRLRYFLGILAGKQVEPERAEEDGRVRAAASVPIIRPVRLPVRTSTHEKAPPNPV